MKKIISIFFFSIYAQVLPAQCISGAARPPLGMNFGILIETSFPEIKGDTLLLGGKCRVLGWYNNNGGKVHLAYGVQWGTGNLPVISWGSNSPNVKFTSLNGPPSNFTVNAGSLKLHNVNYRAFVCVVVNQGKGRHLYYTFCGNTINSAEDGSFALTNNEISNENSVTCSTSQIPLTGSTPLGGLFKTFTYTWQSSTDGVNWANINSATSKDYTIPAISAPSSNLITRYRRIVSSGVRTSTSAPVSVTYLVGSLPAVTLTTSVQNDQASWGAGHSNLHNVSINATPATIFGDYEVRWESSSDGTVFSEVSNSRGSALTVNPASPTWYRAKVYYQNINNCLVISNTLNVSTISDVDSNIYQSVTYGNQKWLVPNLMVTKFNDNTAIKTVTSSAVWAATTTPAWCAYTNSVSYVGVYGNLYNWSVANNTLNVCPNGYHVSTKADWDSLITFNGSALAAGRLKAQAGWRSPNSGVTRFNPFQAMPGGYRSGTNGMFGSFREEGWWWIKNSAVETQYKIKSMWYMQSTVNESAHSITSGASIRCVKD